MKEFIVWFYKNISAFIFAVFVWLVMILFTYSILVTKFSSFSILFCIPGFFFIAAFTHNFFTLTVSAQTGRNLKNFFTGKLKTYGPGFHFIFPWFSKRNGKGIYSLQEVKEDLIEDYPAHDGPKLIAKLMFRYAPNLKYLAQFELVDTNAIREGLKERASSFLLSYIKQKSAEEARLKIDQLQKAIEIEFGISGDSTVVSSLEKSFGIDIKNAALADLDYEPAYQAALTNAKIIEKIMEEADRIYKHHGGVINADGTCKDGGISREKAFDKAMVLFDKATQSTFKGSKTVFATT